MIERSKYEHKLFHLRKIILDGVSYFIVWQGLTREYEDSIQYFHQHKGFWWQYRGFFAPARNALLWSTLMQLSKAFDRNPRTVSLVNLLIAARNNSKELAPYATQDGLADIQIRIYKNTELLQRLRRYRNQRLVHFDADLMDNIELPPGEVQTLTEETKSIYNSIKYSYEEKCDDFNDIMENVYLHTSQVINIMSETEKHG